MLQLTAISIGPEDESCLLPPQHLIRVYAVYIEADTSVWNLDLPGGIGGNLVGDHSAILRQRVSNEPIVSDLEKSTDRRRIIAAAARPLADVVQGRDDRSLRP